MIDVKPRGLDLPKRKIPTELKPVEEKFKRPEIDVKLINILLYKLYYFGKAIGGYASTLIGNALKLAIPTWVWFALIGAVVLVVALVIVL